jgi:acyl carrier protein
MTAEEVLVTLGELVGDVLGTDPIPLTMATRREDIPGFDSFSYVNFIVAVEMRMGIKFSVGELESFKDIGMIVRRILALVPG